ncbi:hypothetical protein N0B40_13765 [Chryseobacterium oranimense]|uniref:hypothetical protein n=1 Tax=Chryseobacterium oranimense TaxID=421058 RepID=UPI0021B04C81|nr:hypothetical protein [Chryseobacterium oranimense]UWX59472.1 hypothetical protein N0B40_13765 [Chryseobacterium oranimense]
MLSEQLKRKRVKNITIDNIEYFDVQDIKDNHPDLKVDVSKIMYIKETALIKAEGVHNKTDFDKMIKQVFPKKD